MFFFQHKKPYLFVLFLCFLFERCTSKKNGSSYLSKPRLEELESFIARDTTLKLKNLTAATQKAIAQFVNAATALLDKVDRIHQPYPLERRCASALEFFKSCITLGYPVPDSFYNTYHEISTFAQHILILSVAINRMMGHQAAAENTSSMMRFIGINGLGSPELLRSLFDEYYESVTFIFKRIPYGLEKADAHVKSGDRRKREETGAGVLGSYTAEEKMVWDAWFEETKDKKPRDDVPTAAVLHKRVEMMKAKHLLSPGKAGAAVGDDAAAGGGGASPKATAAQKAQIKAFYEKHGLTEAQKSTLWSELGKRKHQPQQIGRFDEKLFENAAKDKEIPLKE